MALTLFAIQNAKPKEKPYKLSDGEGLHLLVQPNGSKLWRFRYQFGLKEKMLSLGTFPEVTLASARTKRNEARTLVAESVDPSQQRKTDKVAAATAAGNTFGAIAADYLKKLEDEGKAEATIGKNRWLLEDLAKPLANRPASEIKPAEILSLLKQVEKRGHRETAHRLSSPPNFRRQASRRSSGVSFGRRPIFTPMATARALPSAVLARISSRSNSAKPPRTVSISRPCGVVVSAHTSPRERKAVADFPTDSNALTPRWLF